MTNIEDPSYQAHIEDAARACSCCRECSEHPCPGCLAGGVCDEASCSCHDDDEDDDRDEMAIKSMQFDEACVVLSEAGIEVDRCSASSLVEAIRRLHRDLVHARAAAGELHGSLSNLLGLYEDIWDSYDDEHCNHKENRGPEHGYHRDGYVAAQSLVRRLEPDSKAWEDTLIYLNIQREKASEVPGLTATLDEARHEVAELLRLHPRDEYDEDRDGFVLWWRVPINEPPFVGTPYFDDFPEHTTHWTRLPVPDGLTPSGELEGES